MNVVNVEENLLRRPSQCPSKLKPRFKGPRRLLRFCLLTILLPGVLIAGPLYLRYHVYGDQLYPLAISDMRILDNRVSTIWCQRQQIKVNATFNAFLLPQTPAISHKLKPLSMVRHLDLEDDMKEYWGFYLLRGSTVTVSTCVRWPGASLIVIRGHKHLHECAYIGDDSSEEEDEMDGFPSDDDNPSNKPGDMKRHRPWVQFHHPVHKNQSNHTLDHDQDVEDHETDPKIMKTLLGQLLLKKENSLVKTSMPKDHVHKHRDQTVNQDEKKYLTIKEALPSSKKKGSVEDSEELFRSVLKKLQNMGERGQHVLDKLNQQLQDNDDSELRRLFNETTTKQPGDKSVLNTMGRHWNKHRIHYEDNIEETNRKRREISSAMEKEFNAHDVKGDAAIEEGFEPDGIADHHQIINETTLNDKSNSEFWSSFSSSEEALLNCAGLILNLPLTPHRYCARDRHQKHVEEASLENTVTYRVPSNGYYFFVFNSENEVQINYIRVHFHLNKAVYNISNPVSKCSNSTGNCTLDLKFFSNEKLVVELPVEETNSTMWNQEYVVLSECEPRTFLYGICILSVPIAIILFAFQ